MRLPSLRYALLPLFAALLVSACQGKDDASKAGGSTPEAALQASIDLVKAGDFNGLWKHALPPADYANMRADWGRHLQQPEPISAEDRAKFDETMHKLTEPDAETKLYAELQPKLAAMEQKYKDQLPVLISVGQAVVKSGIAQNQTLGVTQKAQADSVIDVLAPWAQQTPWFDQAKAKQAVGVAVATARKLDLKSPEQLRTMDFDTAMAKYATGYAGLKQLVAIYGLSVDDTLNSIKLTPVSNANGHAVVKVDYTLLGKPLSTESKLVQQDGRWYSEDVLESARKSHRELESAGGSEENTKLIEEAKAAVGLFVSEPLSSIQWQDVHTFPKSITPAHVDSVCGKYNSTDAFAYDGKSGMVYTFKLHVNTHSKEEIESLMSKGEDDAVLKIFSESSKGIESYKKMKTLCPGFG